MRIVKDAAAKAAVQEEEIFTMAVAMLQRKEDPKDLYQYYRRTNTVPSWLVDYCISVITKRETPHDVDHCPSRNCESCRTWLAPYKGVQAEGEAAA